MGGVEIKAFIILPCLLVLLASCGPGGVETAVSTPDFSPYPWIYPRDDEPLDTTETVVSQIAAGDVMLGRGVLAEPDPLSHAALWLSAADLTLGNLEGVITDSRQSTQGYERVMYDGLALLAYFDALGLRAVQVLPVQSGLKPRLLTLAETEPWLTSLLPALPRKALACTELGCQLIDAPLAIGIGRFFSGQIDLTGDGHPETIRRAGERITIYEAGAAVWHSPPEWRVVDVAIGDPNNDGRYEIMLAIWRKDGAGYERSQPYMVGHRGGEYVLLWGGRPVVEPIQELALADVDADGIEELVVIIEQADGLTQSVAVWQWQGWSFSLQWQSMPGWYQDLLVQKEAEQPVITVSTTSVNDGDAAGQQSFLLSS